MKFGISRYLERSRLAAKLVEDWQMEHQHAMFAQDVDQMVAECLQLEGLTKQAWDSFLGLLFSDKEPDITAVDDLAMMTKTAMAKTQGVFENVRAMIDEAQTKGYAVAGAADFAIALQRVRKIREDFDKKVPPEDTKGIEQALADYKRGAYRTAEELLRDAQGCHS